MFLLCANFNQKRKEKRACKSIGGEEKKGQKIKMASPNSPGPLMWGGNQPLHHPIGWSHLNPRCLRMEEPSPALQTQGLTPTVVLVTSSCFQLDTFIRG
jgi:hypothetical protein